MKKLSSLFLLLCMSITMWSANVPSQAPDVMLQAFYWDSYPGGAGSAYGDTGWKTLLKDSVELGEYFDLVWFPPTANGNGTGYIPRQYSNLNSAFGSEADLRLLIGSLKRRNSRAIADIVINHCGNRSNSCDFYTMDFGTYGSFSPNNTWVTTDDEGNCGGGSHADVGYDGEQNYGAARDWDHQNANVQAMCRAYLQWMKAQGYDGWRYDYCKGFTHDHINDYNTAAGAYISVLEYWDGNAGTLQARLNDANWNTMVFDFSLKYNTLNSGICSFNYAKCAVVPKGDANATDAGLLGVNKSKYAVTFIDNHDTFTRNDSEFGGKNNSMSELLKDRLLQAHAYILSMPGIPCVFYPHWKTHKDAIKKMIEARHMTGVHSESTVKDEYAETGGYQATIVGKNGYIVLQLGNKASGTIDGFTKYASGNGYAIWTYVKETEYYMKNNWGGGSDWTWKKMTAAGDGTYKLENVVFGGTGVNYNTSDSDEGNTWVALADFKGDAISAGDKVTFTLNPTAGTVTAKKVEAGGSGDEPGGGDEPAETMTVYFVNVPSWSAVNAFVWPAQGAAYKEWPGEAMKKEEDKINGYDVYSYTFAKTYANIIFNNGDGTQTADLTWSADKPYFYPMEKTDGKYSTAWYAKASIPTSGDEPGGGDEPAETMTVYFVNVPSWSAVKAFVWPAEGSAYKEWPGESMTKEADKINGYDVYSYTFAKTYANIIFNNGDGTQTADLTWSADKPYFYPTEKTNGKYSTAWYAKANIPTSGDEPGGDEPGGDEPAETMTVYFVNVPSWSAVNAFVWPAAGSAYKEWPGEAMTKEDEKINGYDVYSYTFAKTYANIIFNNGDGTQTADLTWSADKPYFYPTEKTNGKYSTAWYAKANIPTSGDEPGGDEPGGDEPAETMTVYFVNVPSWSAVNAFVWPAAGSAYKEWPGESMTKEADKINGYDVYSYTFAKTYANIIFNNGDGTQTADLTWSADKPYFYPTEKTNGKYSTAWYAKASIPTSGDEPGGGDDPEQPAAKFYITGDSALVVDAGLTKDFAWNPAAIKSVKDTMELDLKADQYYVLKVTMNGTWVGDNNVKGYNELTEKAAGLDDVSNDHNIGFKLSKAGKVQVIYTVKEGETIFKLVGEFVTSGDQPGGGDEPAETMTVYFVNVPSWSAVKAFVWPAEGSAYKEWPGESMTKEADKINGYDVYSYTFAKTYANIIFNNGDGTQTADLTWSADKPYFYPMDKTDNKYSTAWYAKASIPTSGDEPGGDEPAETMTVYFVNVPSWSVVNAFVWPAAGSAYKEWPGESMTKEADKINGYDVYSYTFAKTYANIIFNNGDGTQTADLTWSADKPYFYPMEKTDGKYSTAWYAKASIPTSGDEPGGDEPGGDEPAETMTVYFVNVPSWSAVNAFVWPAAGSAYKEWPGESMTKEADKINGYDVYSYTFAKTYANIIFNNGDGTQTADLTWSADKPYFYPTDKTDNKYSSAWYAKANIPTSGDQPGGGDDPVTPGETLDLQLVPGVWELADIKVAAWAWKDGENGAWTAFFAPKAEGNDTLTVKIPAKADKIIFVGFKSDVEEPDWAKEEARVDAGDIDKQGLTFTITGATTGTWEKVDGPVVPPTPAIVDGYYLVGTISEWGAAAEYLFAVNPDNTEEYVLHTTLAAGDGIKVVKVAGGVLTDWYPEGMGTEYTVDAEHAGKVTIYFRPAGNEEWSAFGGFIYIVVDEPTGLDVIQSSAQAVKVMRDGRMYILRDARTYTTTGQLVR